MKRLHLVGQKNAGKTTLLLELVSLLTASGYKVGTIKHTRHHHELDVPGKDSQRHRTAGGNPAAILSAGLTAVFFKDDSPTDRYAALASIYSQCDLVLVEGDRDTTAPKVEVWRAVVGKLPYAAEDSSIHAIISDDPLPVELSKPVWPRTDLNAIAKQILDLL